MKIALKKSRLTLTLLCILAISLASAPFGHAVASTPKDSMLTFLQNVANINVSSYNVTLVSNGEPYNVINSASQEQVRYILQNANGTLDATCLFQNNALVWFMMSVTSGTPTLIKQPSTDLLSDANTVLDNYMNYSGSNHVQVMKDLLNTVNSAKDTTITNGNINLTITIDGLTGQFEWVNTYNGAGGPGMSIEFYNGTLENLDDHESLFSIGSTAVNINQASAINIALTRLKNFTWSIGSDPITAENVTKFTLKTNSTEATLSMQVRGDLTTLYPMWRIEIPVDQIYIGNNLWSGSPTSVVVGIWADTSAVNYCQELSYGGSIPQPTDTPSLPQTTSNSMAWLTFGIVIGAVVITMTIAAVTIVNKRRTKRKNK